MNEATLNYLMSIAKSDVQKKLIQIFSEKLDQGTDVDVNPDVILEEILDYIRRIEQ